MKLSVSNIGWVSNDDESVFETMHEKGFSGLEIAPTRIIPESPYNHISQARRYVNDIRKRFGFVVSSMQSICYGVTEKLFGSESERRQLLIHTKKAIRFAEAIGCHNLVFGCPRNRFLPKCANPSIAISFFRELGDYAFRHNTFLAIEPTPIIYNTNYINTTLDALNLIRIVNSEGFKLNLDVGTMIFNNEDVSILYGSESLINHVHISEPGLVPIKKRFIHQELAKFLQSSSYEKFISIEVTHKPNINNLFQTMDYVYSLFHSL